MDFYLERKQKYSFVSFKRRKGKKRKLDVNDITLRACTKKSTLFNRIGKPNSIDIDKLGQFQLHLPQRGHGGRGTKVQQPLRSQPQHYKRKDIPISVVLVLRVVHHHGRPLVVSIGHHPTAVLQNFYPVDARSHVHGRRPPHGQTDLEQVSFGRLVGVVPIGQEFQHPFLQILAQVH